MVILGSITEAARRYWSYRRARAELSALDDRILKDIGVTRGEIDLVARRTSRTAASRRPGAATVYAPRGLPVAAQQ